MEREQLERMMQEGEVKAFREGDKIKFLKEDIELLKMSKMDQDTIVAHKEGDALLIEEIVEDDEKNSEDTAEEEETPKPLFAMGEDGEIGEDISESPSTPEKEQTGFMFLGEKAADKDEKPVIANNQPSETKSLLGLPNDTNIQQPLLDIYHQHKERVPKNYDAIKADTEELVFERESGDDLLETGELLFESKDQVLPRDKEMEELFTDSEMNISPYDARDQAIEEAWDLAESTGEDIASSDSTSGNKSSRSLAIDESQRRKKVKSFGTVAAGTLAFAVLAFFIFFSKQQTDLANVKVKLYQIEEKSIARDRQSEGILPAAQMTSLNAPVAGKIVELLPAGTMVKVGTPLASLWQEADTRQIQELEKQMAGCQSRLQSAVAHKELIANTAKASSTSQALKKQLSAAKKPDEKQQYEREYKKATQEFQAYLQKYQEMKKNYEKELPADVSQHRQVLNNLLTRQETQMTQQIHELEKSIAEKSREEGKKTTFMATQQGVIRKWLVASDTTVAAQQPLVEISLLQAEFIVPEGDALDWKSGEAIQLKWEEKTLTGTIDKIYQDRGTTPVTWRISALVNPADYEVKQGSKIMLQYQKQYQGILEVPREAVIQEAQRSFVLKTKADNKVYKCEVRPDKSNDNLWPVTGDIFKGDLVIRQIVSPKNKQLKDLRNGQTVIVQNE
jgi:hypothetical protein